MRRLLPLACILLTTRTPVLAVYWQHGNCIAYLNQTLPFVPNTANHCFTDHSSGIEYCLYSDCPRPPCRRPVYNGHICKSCPGRCQEGERFYKVGDKFLSYDGFRKCHCQHDPGFGAKMFCEVIGEPDPFNFCGIPYPFGYKKGVDLSNTQSFNNGVINNVNAHHNSVNNGGGPLQGGVNSIPKNNPYPVYWPPSPAPPPTPAPRAVPIDNSGGLWVVDFGAGGQQQQQPFVNSNGGQQFVDQAWPVGNPGFPGQQWPAANGGNQHFGNGGNFPGNNNGGNQWQNNNGQNGGHWPNNNRNNGNNGGHWPNNNNNGNNGGNWPNNNHGNNGNNGNNGGHWPNNNHGNGNNGGHWPNNNNNHGNGNNGGHWPNNNNHNNGNDGSNGGHWPNNNNNNHGNNGGQWRNNNRNNHDNNGNNGGQWRNNNNHNNGNNGNNGGPWPNNNHGGGEWSHNSKGEVIKFEAK